MLIAIKHLERWLVHKDMPRYYNLSIHPLKYKNLYFLLFSNKEHRIIDANLFLNMTIIKMWNDREPYSFHYHINQLISAIS